MLDTSFNFNQAFALVKEDVFFQGKSEWDFACENEEIIVLTFKRIKDKCNISLIFLPVW